MGANQKKYKKIPKTHYPSKKFCLKKYKEKKKPL